MKIMQILVLINQNIYIDVNYWHFDVVGIVVDVVVVVVVVDVRNYAEIKSDSSFLIKTGSKPNSPIPANSNLRASATNLSASFNILALRQAEALQKYREITQSR